MDSCFRLFSYISMSNIYFFFNFPFAVSSTSFSVFLTVFLPTVISLSFSSTYTHRNLYLPGQTNASLNLKAAMNTPPCSGPSHFCKLQSLSIPSHLHVPTCSFWTLTHAHWEKAFICLQRNTCENRFTNNLVWLRETFLQDFPSVWPALSFLESTIRTTWDTVRNLSVVVGHWQNKIKNSRVKYSIPKRKEKQRKSETKSRK